MTVIFQVFSGTDFENVENFEIPLGSAWRNFEVTPKALEEKVEIYEFRQKFSSGVTIFAAAHKYRDGRPNTDIYWEVWAQLDSDGQAELVDGPWVVLLLPGSKLQEIVTIDEAVMDGLGSKIHRVGAKRHVAAIPGVIQPSPWEEPWYDTHNKISATGSAGSVHGPPGFAVTLSSFGYPSKPGKEVLDALDWNLDVTMQHRRIHRIGKDGEPAFVHTSGVYPYDFDLYGQEDVVVPPVPRPDGTTSGGVVTPGDKQHGYRAIRHLAAAKITGSRAELRAGMMMLRAMAGDPLWCESHPKYDENKLPVGNQRELGWVLDAALLGFALDPAQVWISELIDKITNIVELLKGSRDDFYWLALNSNSKTDDSHQRCRVHAFQTGVLADAILRAGHFASRGLKLHAARTLQTLVADEEAGKFWKDLDPYTDMENSSGPPRFHMGSYGGKAPGSSTEKWIWPAACHAIQQGLDEGGKLERTMKAAWRNTVHMKLGNTYFDPSVFAACFPTMQSYPGS